MKNSLYFIAGLVLVIWAIIFLGFDTNSSVHLLLALAGIILIIRIFFGRQLTGK